MINETTRDALSQLKGDRHNSISTAVNLVDSKIDHNFTVLQTVRSPGYASTTAAAPITWPRATTMAGGAIRRLMLIGRTITGQ
jgi:hypothetical protein